MRPAVIPSRHLVPSLLLCLALVLGAGAVWSAARQADPTAPAPSLDPDPPGSPAAVGALPDLAVRPTEQLLIAADPVESRRLLRFSTTIANVGTAPMELLGEPDAAAGTVVVRQRLPGGTVREVGTFIYDAAHGHWHFDALVVTELWTLGSDGTPDQLVAATGKTSFCLVDAWRLTPPPTGAAMAPEFLVCVPERQGLSPGWADRYDATLPGQALEITGMPDGRYVLRTVLDPDGLLSDADPANNTLTVIVELIGERATAVP